MKLEELKKELPETPDFIHNMILEEVTKQTGQEKIVPIRKSWRRNSLRIAAAVAVMILLLGSGTIAYAMDIGGIQRLVQIWIHGDQTTATMTVENGTYTLNYKDKDGKMKERSGGGVAINEDGSERPLTEEELVEEINQPEVIYEDDGKVMVYFMDQQWDITDKFEDGICYIQIEIEGEIQYITVKYQNGYALSSHGYVQPWEFN